MEGGWSFHVLWIRMQAVEQIYFRVLLREVAAEKQGKISMGKGLERGESGRKWVGN